MLPEPVIFDGFVAGMIDAEARLDFLAIFGQQLELLIERAGRARALAALELYERTRSYAQVGLKMHVSRARVAQLVRDGREWRIFDAT